MADRKLGDLTGRIKVDKTDVTKAVSSTKSEVGALEGVFNKSFGNISSIITNKLGVAGGEAQKALDGIKSSAVSSGGALQTILAGGALAAAAGIGALAAKGVGAFVDLTGQIRAFQRVTGASAQDASKLVGEMQHLGIDSTTASKAMGIFAKNIESTPATLSKLGIEIVRNKDGSVNLTASLGEVAKAYQAVGAGAEGTNIALKVFGRGGAALIPLLSKTHEELDAIDKSLAAKGLIFDQRALDQGKQFSLAMHDLGQSVKGLEISLGRALVPPLAKGAQYLTQIIDDVRQLGSVKIPIPTTNDKGFTIGSLFKDAAKYGNSLDEILNKLPGHQDKAAAAAGKHAASEQDVAQAEAEAADKADQEAKALDALLNAQVSLVDATLGVQGAQDAFIRSMADAKDKATALSEAIRLHGANSAEAAAATRDLAEANHAEEEAASRQAHAVADQAEQQALANGETFTAQQKTDAYKQALHEAALEIGGPVGAALDAMAAKIDGLPPVELAISNYDEFLNQIATVSRQLDALSNSGQIKITGNLPGSHNVPLRAAGGPVEAGQPYVVGEERPELFVPNVSGRILPTVPRGWDGASSATAAAGASEVIEVTSYTYLDGDRIATTTARQNRMRKVARS